MISTELRFVAVEAGILVAALSLGTACTDILEVNDPDVVERGDLSGSQGADLLWAGGLRSFAGAFGGGSASHNMVGAFLTDEYHIVSVDGGEISIDLRGAGSDNYLVDGIFRNLHEARVSTRNAADFLDELGAQDAKASEMWSLNGYTHLMLGEDFCSGVPLGQLSLEGDILLGQPTTTVDLFEFAVARFETALAEAEGDAARENLARIGMGRALMNLGRYSDAALAVAAVPTEWAYAIFYGTAFWNGHFQSTTGKHASLSDREGHTGLPFRTADDPRLPWAETGVGVDGQSPVYAQLKFPASDAQITLASGLEARYIQAEAALEAGNVSGFLEHLNQARQAQGLNQISDPGSYDARLDLLFYERGFTFFGEGHRLGDMRRLVRQYGRDAEEVFPSGDYHRPGSYYGTDVNLSLPDSERDNPNFVGCLDRGA
jgi:hypothetical protein